MPPIVAIALALLTKEVYLSLFAGCALGALLAAEFHPWIAFDTLFNTMIDSVDFSILMFMILLGMIVMLMQESGGTRAYGEWAALSGGARRYPVFRVPAGSCPLLRGGRQILRQTRPHHRADHPCRHRPHQC